MPSLTWSQSVAPAATFNPLTDWQYQYVPYGGGIEILHQATAVGMVSTITSGSDTLQERAPVPAGGTIGVIPSAFDVPAVTDEVAAGDFLKIGYENPTAGTINVEGTIAYGPA